MKIIDAIFQLNQAFAEQDGEVLQINLNKKAVEALQRECSLLWEIVECPHCGKRGVNKEVCGIEIIQSEGGEVFGVKVKDEKYKYALNVDLRKTTTVQQFEIGTLYKNRTGSLWKYVKQTYDIYPACQYQWIPWNGLAKAEHRNSGMTLSITES